MSEQDAVWQEKRLDEILASSVDAAAKAQQIIHLGFDPEIADELVERQQLGVQMPMYYETLRQVSDIRDDGPSASSDIA